MTLESGKVVAGDTIQAADFNKLRNDLLSNHTHASGEGGTVDHADLTETGDMSGMGHRHEDIDVHLNGDGPGPNSIDNPGGSMGVHGLASVARVAGSLNGQFVIDAGSSGPGTSGSVTFTTSFDGVPYIATGIIASSGDTRDLGVRVYNQSASGFDWTGYSGYPLTLNWVAVGTKS